jgi:hypothetical protein
MSSVHDARYSSDTISEILGYLPSNEIICAGNICKPWHKASKSKNALKKAYFCISFDKPSLVALNSLAHIGQLGINGRNTKLTSNENYSHYEKMNFDGKCIYNQNMVINIEEIKSWIMHINIMLQTNIFTNLRVLYIDTYKICESFCNALKSCKTLESLGFYNDSACVDKDNEYYTFDSQEKSIEETVLYDNTPQVFGEMLEANLNIKWLTIYGLSNSIIIAIAKVINKTNINKLILSDRSEFFRRHWSERRMEFANKLLIENLNENQKITSLILQLNDKIENLSMPKLQNLVMPLVCKKESITMLRDIKHISFDVVNTNCSFLDGYDKKDIMRYMILDNIHILDKITNVESLTLPYKKNIYEDSSLFSKIKTFNKLKNLTIIVISDDPIITQCNKIMEMAMETNITSLSIRQIGLHSDISHSIEQLSNSYLRDYSVGKVHDLRVSKDCYSCKVWKCDPFAIRNISNDVEFNKFKKILEKNKNINIKLRLWTHDNYSKIFIDVFSNDRLKLDFINVKGGHFT